MNSSPTGCLRGLQIRPGWQRKTSTTFSCSWRPRGCSAEPSLRPSGRRGLSSPQILASHSQPLRDKTRIVCSPGSSSPAPTALLERASSDPAVFLLVTLGLLFVFAWERGQSAEWLPCAESDIRKRPPELLPSSSLRCHSRCPWRAPQDQPGSPPLPPNAGGHVGWGRSHGL